MVTSSQLQRCPFHRVLFKKRPNVKVINEGQTAYKIGFDGQYIQEFAAGETIYEGPSLITAFSTLRCYGFGFNLFPFADSGQQLQMRIANMSIPHVLANLPSIWKGTYRHEDLMDFHVDKVRVICENPQPLQIGGDAEGYHTEALYELSEQATYLADFSKPKQLPSFNKPTTTPRRLEKTPR